MLVAALAWRADGSDTIATATATLATLWGAMAGTLVATDIVRRLGILP